MMADMRRFQSNPTTNDAIMDYSLEEDEPLSSPYSNAETPSVPRAKKFKPGNENDRWFVLDDRGEMKFVDGIEDDFSLESGFSSPPCSDSLPSATSSGSSRRTPSVVCVGECSSVQHRRTWSDSSAITDLDHVEFSTETSLPESQQCSDFIAKHRENRANPKLPPQICTMPPSRLHVRPPSKHTLEQPGEASPSPVYVRDTKIPVCGWFKACRWCGSWTGSSADVVQEEIPMCGRCNVKWQKILDGADPSQFAFAFRNSDDLLIKHVKMRLKQNPGLERRAVCQTAMLEIHETWISHNGEMQQC